MPVIPAQAVKRVAQRAARRALASSSLLLAGQGLAGGSGAALVTIIALRATSNRAFIGSTNLSESWPLVLAAGAALGISAGLALAVARRWTIAHAALELDTRLGLSDRQAVPTEDRLAGRVGDEGLLVERNALSPVQLLPLAVSLSFD